MKSLRSTLMLALSAIALLFIVQAGILSWGQKSIQADVVDVARRNTMASSNLSELAVLAQQIRRYEKEYFVYVGNVEKRESYIKEWTNTSNKIAKLLATMRLNADQAFSVQDQEKISSWTGAAEFYDAEMKRIFVVVNDRQAQLTSVAAPATNVVGKATADATASTVTMFSPIEVNLMIGAGKDRLSSVLIKGVAELSAIKTTATLGLDESASASFNRLWLAVGVTVVLGLLLAVLLAWRLPRAVTEPVAELTAAVDRMSKGELDQSIAEPSIKELVGLTASLERMRVAQRTLLQRMRQTRGS
jgi:methyl-accepting chemotaxis protein